MHDGGKPHAVVFGLVVGVYIDDSVIRDGMVDTSLMRPIARLGYRDYAQIDVNALFRHERARRQDLKRLRFTLGGVWRSG